jgi:hypothetical protein
MAMATPPKVLMRSIDAHAVLGCFRGVAIALQRPVAEQEERGRMGWSGPEDTFVCAGRKGQQSAGSRSAAQATKHAAHPGAEPGKLEPASRKAEDALFLVAHPAVPVGVDRHAKYPVPLFMPLVAFWRHR